jgi:neutral ceramidase
MRSDLVSVAVMGTAVWAGTASGETVNWKVGTAKAVITPEKAVWLAGYGGKRAPAGKLHDLWMKVLAFEDAQGRRAMLITTDHQGMPRAMSERIARKMSERFKLDRSQVLITFSHNHCGPRLIDDLWDYYPVDAEQEKLVAEYTDQMVDRTVETVGQALAVLSPARLSMGEGTCTFAVNRRNNPEPEVPDLMARGVPLKGPNDHSVPVLTVHGQPDRLTAVLFGYACHATTLSFDQWCGDYPGFAQIDLERAHPGTMASFIAGCGGDQNPLPRRKVELCEKYGRMLSDAVEKVLEQPLKPIGPGLRTAFERVELPYLKNMTREELEAGTKSSNPIYARWSARLLKRLDTGETFRPSYPYPVQVWKLGSELLLIALGGEAVVDYSLRFKKEFGPGTWVCGYASDLVAYIPSRRVWEEGGYEGGAALFEYGHPAVRWGGEVEERIATTVQRLVRKVSQP